MLFCNLATSQCLEHLGCRTGAKLLSDLVVEDFDHGILWCHGLSGIGLV